MQSIKNKKGEYLLDALTFLFSLFGVILLLVVFYLWAGSNVADKTKTQSDKITSQLQFETYFTEILIKYADEIIKQDSTLEQKIQKYIEEQTQYSQHKNEFELRTACKKNKCTIYLTPGLEWSKLKESQLTAHKALYRFYTEEGEISKTTYLPSTNGIFQFELIMERG